MPVSKFCAPLGLALALGLACLPKPAAAATSGNNGTHDPSRMLQSNDRFYVYSTGGSCMSSADGLAWKSEPSPPWNRSLAGNQGIWAPDGIYLNGQYYLFSSMWSSAKASAITLLTSPTLDPTAPNYKFTDHGVVVAGPAGVTHSVIDPAPVLDADGNLWIVWGGGYPFATTADSVFVTRLDNQTGMPLTSDPAYNPPNSPGHAIEQGHKEGTYIHYHANYYYLFWQTGSCCSGTSSTYTMHVARSSAITGPYSGDRTFYAGTGNVHGPGHIGIYSACGQERFTYHYYPTNGSILGENLLTWSSDGWPQVGADATTALKPCATSGPYGAGGAGSVGSGGATGAAGAVGTGSGGTSGGADAGGTNSGGTAAGGVIDGSAGTIAYAGQSTTSGGASAGGSGPTAGGTSPVAIAGSTSTAGTTTNPGSAGTAANTGDAAASGCGCALPGHTSEHGGWLLAAVGLALTALRRRRL